MNLKNWENGHFRGFYTKIDHFWSWSNLSGVVRLKWWFWAKILIFTYKSWYERQKPPHLKGWTQLKSIKRVFGSNKNLDRWVKLTIFEHDSISLVFFNWNCYFGSKSTFSHLKVDMKAKNYHTLGQEASSNPWNLFYIRCENLKQSNKLTILIMVKSNWMFITERVIWGQNPTFQSRNWYQWQKFDTLWVKNPAQILHTSIFSRWEFHWK